MQKIQSSNAALYMQLKSKGGKQTSAARSNAYHSPIVEELMYAENKNVDSANTKYSKGEGEVHSSRIKKLKTNPMLSEPVINEDRRTATRGKEENETRKWKDERAGNNKTHHTNEEEHNSVEKEEVNYSLLSPSASLSSSLSSSFSSSLSSLSDSLNIYDGDTGLTYHADMNSGTLIYNPLTPSSGISVSSPSSVPPALFRSSSSTLYATQASVDEANDNILCEYANDTLCNMSRLMYGGKNTPSVTAVKAKVSSLKNASLVRKILKSKNYSTGNSHFQGEPTKSSALTSAHSSFSSPPPAKTSKVFDSKQINSTQLNESSSSHAAHQISEQNLPSVMSLSNFTVTGVPPLHFIPFCSSFSSSCVELMSSCASSASFFSACENNSNMCTNIWSCGFAPPAAFLQHHQQVDLSNCSTNVNDSNIIYKNDSNILYKSTSYCPVASSVSDFPSSSCHEVLPLSESMYGESFLTNNQLRISAKQAARISTSLISPSPSVQMSSHTSFTCAPNDHPFVIAGREEEGTGGGEDVAPKVEESLYKGKGVTEAVSAVTENAIMLQSSSSPIIFDTSGCKLHILQPNSLAAHSASSAHVNSSISSSSRLSLSSSHSPALSVSPPSGVPFLASAPQCSSAAAGSSAAINTSCAKGSITSLSPPFCFEASNSPSLCVSLPFPSPPPALSQSTSSSICKSAFAAPQTCHNEHLQPESSFCSFSSSVCYSLSLSPSSSSPAALAERAAALESFVKCHSDKYCEVLAANEDVYIVSYRGVILHSNRQKQQEHFWIFQGMTTKIYWLKGQIRQGSFQPKSQGGLRLPKAEVHLTTRDLRMALQSAGQVVLCCRSNKEGGCNRVLNADRFPIEGHSRKVRCVDCFGIYKMPQAERRRAEREVKRRVDEILGREGAGGAQARIEGERGEERGIILAGRGENSRMKQTMETQRV